MEEDSLQAQTSLDLQSMEHNLPTTTWAQISIPLQSTDLISLQYTRLTSLQFINLQITEFNHLDTNKVQATLQPPTRDKALSMEVEVEVEVNSVLPIILLIQEQALSIRLSELRVPATVLHNL